MTDRISSYQTGPATTFYLECDRVGQDINGNFTRLHIYLRAVNGPGATTSSQFNNFGAHIAVIDGIGEIGRHQGQPFMPSGYTNGQWRWRDGPWQVDIGHNSDGTRGGITLRMQTRYSGHDVDTTAWFDDFPTIPRASTPSFSPSNWIEAGQSVTINTNRASSGFTHDLHYSFGGGWVSLAGGVGASTSWTPPLSLLNAIPNSPTGIGQLLCYTFSGGTNIGSKIIDFGISTPASVIPTWSSVSVSEANPDVTTYVGAYVQNVSKLNYAINGAAGVYSSSINLQRFSAAGQAVDGATGTTPSPIASSGTVPVTWTIQDTRGRQKAQTSNITVLPYVNPIVNSATIQRALSDGTPDPDEGTYIRVDLNAAVQSLMNTTQRNVMQVKVRTRPVGSTTPWTDASTLKTTLNPSGITYNSFTTIPGPYAVDASYEVRVEVLDRFNMSAYQSTVSVGAIFMHWDDEGLGVGKYRENGVLDVGGDIWVSGDIYTRTPSSGMVPHFTKAILDQNYVGPGPAKVKFWDGTAFGTLSSTEYQWLGKQEPWGNRVVNMARLNGTWYIFGHNNEGGFGGKVDIPLTNNWIPYNTRNGISYNRYSMPKAQRLPSGIVQLQGLVGYGTSTAAATIGTLPPGYRPDTPTIFPVNNGDQARTIVVQTDGRIQVEASNWISNTYVSLDGIAFPAAGVATWTDVGTGGSAFANGWSAYNSAGWGTPAFWKDPYGFVWFRGLVGGGASSTDNTLIFSLPSTHQQYTQSHNKASSASTFGFVSGFGGGLAWKNGTLSNAWISLGGVIFMTADAISNNPWVELGTVNGWVWYGGAFPTPAILRREDGLVITRGLLRAGTVGNKMAIASAQHVPQYEQILAAVSGSAWGRVDVYNKDGNDDHRGAIVPVAGTNAWVSWDGLTWMAGD